MNTKLEVPAQNLVVKSWGPFALIDNELVSAVAFTFPWPFRGVQIQILKMQTNEASK